MRRRAVWAALCCVIAFSCESKAFSSNAGFHCAKLEICRSVLMENVFVENNSKDVHPPSFKLQPLVFVTSCYAATANPVSELALRMERGARRVFVHARHRKQAFFGVSQWRANDAASDINVISGSLARIHHADYDFDVSFKNDLDDPAIPHCHFYVGAQLPFGRIIRASYEPVSGDGKPNGENSQNDRKKTRQSSH
jgi:hypothetical protein